MPVGVLILCAWLTGCKDKNEIKVYRVSNAEPESMQSPESQGMETASQIKSPADAAGQQTPAGNPPSNWEAQPLTAMRMASFLVRGDKGTVADISLVSLAGPAGGILDNVNRWLSQLGRPAVTAEQLQHIATHVNTPIGDVIVVDLEGLAEGADPSKDGRIIAGIASGDNGTFFFKMRGNSALVESQKDAFINYIGSVRMAGSPTSPPAPPMESEHTKIQWKIPDQWTPVAPSAMRYASCVATGKNGESADISVTVFPGEGGDDLGNVNRWRTQTGLGEIRADELKSLIISVPGRDGGILTVDMNGPKARILAGWTRANGKAWFFKLTGPDDLAESEKPRFIELLKSVQFPP